MSSLAAQLAQSASLNTNLLADRSRRKSGESYLFTGREADQYDLESIHSLGVNGLLQLASLDPSLQQFEDQLLSDHAKATDRTLLSAEANLSLDKSINNCLSMLGPYLMETPTGKVLEWLVRRFRINEFNVEAVLALFLPYHESPHFAKMITILHIKPNSTWSFLLQFKSAAQNVPRISLVTEMLRNSDVARFVTSLLPTALKEGHSHRVLLAFNAACLHDFILRSPHLDEGTVAYLLPAFLEPLQHVPNIRDATLGSYVLLATLSQKCQIAPAALKAIISAMAGCAEHVSTRHFTNGVLSVCEPQVELDQVSDKTVKNILRIPNIGEELRMASSWNGIEKLLCPLLPGLTKRLADEPASSLLGDIIAIPEIPTVVIGRCAKNLIDVIIAEEVPASSIVARRLLVTIQQRHPSTLSEAMEMFCQQNEAVKDSMDQLLISLSVVQGMPTSTETSHKGNVDLLLASTSSDSKVRAVAVKGMITSLQDSDNLSLSELESVHSALLARVQDTNNAVLEALYDQPSIILPILTKNSKTYIDHVSSNLTSPGSKPKRNLLRMHLTFLASHFCPASPPCTDDVFLQVFFPFLLFSKPRQHTAEIVWDVISNHFQGPESSTSKTREWLAGCLVIIGSQGEKSDADPVDRMSNFNLAISAQIAANVMKSNNYQAHLDVLVTKLQEPNPHTRVLSYLIVHALLGILSGEHQLDAAVKVMDAMDIKDVSGIEDSSARNENLFEVNDAIIGKYIVGKPSGKHTLQWLQLLIVSQICKLPRPAGLILDWISDSSPEIQTDKRGSYYVDLMRSIYHTANVSNSSPRVIIHLLQALFMNLGDDVLAFLAGIWTNPLNMMDGDGCLSLVALHHAVAFLRAHLTEADGTDFQTIHPSLIVALRSHNRAIREAALECISLLSQSANHKFSAVYKFDAIYGQSNDELQYLDRDDFKKYLDSLDEHRDHLAHDVDYIKLFHQEHLGQCRGEKKRNSDYKHRVLCYILSHINALALPVAQVALLETLDAISDNAKALILLPTIQRLVTGPNLPAVADDLLGLAALLLPCLDASVVNDLNNVQGMLWSVFIATLKAVYTGGSKSLQLVLTQVLERGTFVGLSLERKIEVCNLLIDIGSHNGEMYTTCKRLLATFLQEVPLVVHILNSLHSSNFGTSNFGTSPRANKRAKLTETPINSLSRLSFFVEVLGSQSLPGSLDLISHLLETLNRVLQSISPSQADVSYIQQLLMSAIENVANKITVIPNLSPSIIRLDILVELIRVADNPQTFHQALLLMANLARLAPDSVLHNVMPVFTFMGSNVFHRDDTYSFNVVQQTIDSIVPVMVSSLKRAHSQPLSLFVASKEFLRVFTDAANHIPRHRRTNFFAHLVEVLGSDDFLSPVCMLLVEKVANRVARQNQDDVRASLSLPLSILHHSPHALQLPTLIEILRESQRLVGRITHPEADQQTFLDIAIDDEHAIPPAVMLKRRAQALIVFVGHALKTSTSLGSSLQGESISTFVAGLITLATLQEDTSIDPRVDDITSAARLSINKALAVMSVTDFINAVLSMIESGDRKVQIGAFDLLSERLSSVSTKMRQDITPIVNKIIEALGKIITQGDNHITPFAFRALKSIGLTLCSGEESSLTNVIPQILMAIKRQNAAPLALATLSPLPLKLGPRILPYFREIVALSVATIREGTPELMADAYNILHGLLSSIPTFWGTGEVTQVVNLYIDHHTTISSLSSLPMSGLMKAIAKRAPAKTLLPAMIEIWSSLQASPQMAHIIAYFDILTRALRSAARSVVLEHLRRLYKVFLESFDITKVTSGAANDAETLSILGFRELVVKLNEAAFRPIFRRLYDWAFADDTADIARQITFCHIYDELLNFFKGLMIPYMSFLLEPFVKALRSFHAAALDNQTFWTGILETITKSLKFDEGVYWKDDRLRQISSPLIEQVKVCVQLNYADGKALLQECLSALTECVTDDALLKRINLDLLMHTRSEDVRIRLLALTCSAEIWRTHGGKLLGFVAETTSFIAECSEDENDMVVRESFKLKDAVESVAGNINGL